MEYHTIRASLPGAPNPLIEKRTADVKTFQIDVSPLLVSQERAFGEVTAKVLPDSNITISDVRARQGQYVAFKLAGGPNGNPAYSDHTISITFKTTKGNTLEAVAILRVHAK